VNKERLEKTAELLEQLALTRQYDIIFDMGTWGSYEQGDSLCGSSACAVGYAALDPWFQEQGLRLRYENEDGDLLEVFSVQEFNEVLKKDSEIEFEPYFQGLVVGSAVRAFYELEDGDDVNYLFGPNNRNDPAKVAAKIRRFIAQNGKVTSDAITA
jgi:hypothetical protein